MIQKLVLTLLLTLSLGQVIRAQEMDGYRAREIADSLEKKGNYPQAVKYYQLSNQALAKDQVEYREEIFQNYRKLITYEYWNKQAAQTKIDFLSFIQTFPEQDSLIAYSQYVRAVMAGRGFDVGDLGALDSALAYFMRDRNILFCAMASRRLGMYYGDWDLVRSDQHYGQSAEYFKRLPKSKYKDLFLMDVLVERGECLTGMGRYQLAFECFDKAETYFKHEADKQSMSNSDFYKRQFRQLAQTHGRIGNLALALSYLNSSIQLAKNIGLNNARQLFQRSEALRKSNRQRASIKLVNQSLQLNYRISKQTWLLISKGWSFYELGELDSAQHSFEKALEFSYAVNRKATGYLSLIGLVVSSGDDIEKAKKWIAQIKENHVEQMDQGFHMAEIELMKQARNYEDIIGKIEKYFEFHFPTISIDSLLNSDLYYRPDDLQDALYYSAYSKKNQPLMALSDYLANISIVPGYAPFTQRITLHRNIISILRAKKEYTLFQEDLIWQGDEIRSYYSDLLNLYYQLASYTHDNSDYEAFRIVELSKNHLIHVNENRESFENEDIIPKNILKLERKLALEESRVRSLIPHLNGRDSVRNELKLTFVQKSRDSLFRAIVNQYPEYHEWKYREHEIFTVDRVQEELEPDEAFLEYFVGDTTSYAFVITQQDYHMIPIKLDSDTLIEPFRDQMRMLKDPKKLHGLSYRIYQAYIQPALAQLAEDINTLIVSPAGPLYYIPLEVLANEPSTTHNKPNYLIHMYDIRYAHSASLYFLEQETPITQTDYVAFAPDYSTPLANPSKIRSFGKFRNQITNLEYNDDEVSSLGGYLSGKSYIGKQATEKNFKEALENSGIIHLAMHAIVDDERPMNSRLIFADEPDSLEDGSLHAFELYDMKIPAHLTVLSACETGYGKLANGEGALSLARAFSYAGCPSIVMSHWPVDDQSTSEIMTAFYKYLSKGWNKGKALRQAKLDFLEHGDPARLHPFYWGSFVLQGDPRPITSSPDRRWMIMALPILVMLALLIRQRQNRKRTFS